MTDRMGLPGEQLPISQVEFLVALELGPRRHSRGPGHDRASLERLHVSVMAEQALAAGLDRATTRKRIGPDQALLDAAGRQTGPAEAFRVHEVTQGHPRRRIEAALARAVRSGARHPEVTKRITQTGGVTPEPVDTRLRYRTTRVES